MKVTIFGEGNVGTHLDQWMKGDPEIEVTLLSSRNITPAVSEPDYIIISVSDKAIDEVAAKIKTVYPAFKGIVCHTAGSVSIEVLKPYFEFYGVLYPLQTFSKEDKTLDYPTIPVFIEGNGYSSLKRIEKLAHVLSSKVYLLSSQQRKNLHIASVFACNFTNAMYMAAQRVLQTETDIPFSTMLPLIGKTVSKLENMEPFRGQTGPARRGDEEILKDHIKCLKNLPEEREIYETISKYIMNQFNKN